MKKTKIVCSIGPSSSSVPVMTEMVKNGMNVVRINCSHAKKEDKVEVTKVVQEVRKITGMPIPIMYDTKGPEFRNGVLENDGIKLVEGKTIKIVKENVVGNEERFTVNHPEALDSLKIGSIILLQNGLMKVEVSAIDLDEKGNRTGVTCKIINGGTLGSKKSLCTPGIHLNIPFISDIDREDLVFACKNDCDFLSLSFVTKKEDVLQVKEILKENNREDIKLISKIESQTGFDKLDEIIDISDGIMVGRGDLGDEIQIGKLLEYQKHIIRRCREEGKVVIVATEMMESMIKNARPTRAEVSDVANAVLDGTDAIMLSGETTIGKYPIEVVRFMGEIADYTEKYYDYSKNFDVKFKGDIYSVLARSVVGATNNFDIKLIVVSDKNIELAKQISNLKPKSLIIVATENTKLANSLAFNYGIYSLNIDSNLSIEKITELIKEESNDIIELNKNDNIIFAGDIIQNNKEIKCVMKIEKI